jgi:hypothetical protein
MNFVMARGDETGLLVPIRVGTQQICVTSLSIVATFDRVAN